MRRWILLCFCAALLSVVRTHGSEELLPATTITSEKTLALAASEKALALTSSEEALFVRRIIEFWKDKDDALVKAQIKQFFSLYPDSEFSDGLYAILGDVHWNEGLFQSALEAYDDIYAAAYQQKVFSKRLDCLYQLKLYTQLIESVRPHLPRNSYTTPEQTLWVFYYAEALVRLAKQQSDQIQAQQHYRLARTSYESLLISNYADAAKLALTEVYQALELPQEALAFYLELAEKQPENKEDFLFEAARLQASSDLQKGMSAFLHLREMNGKRASDAALSVMTLLFNQRRYQELIHESEICKKLLSSQQQSACHFLLGKSYAALNQHEKVLHHLQPLLIQALNESDFIPTEAKPNERAVLLLLIVSAHHLNELALVETWSHRYEAIFSNDSALAHVWYINALTYKNCDRFQEAQVLLEKIMTNYPTFEKMAMVQLEQAALLSQQKKWNECLQAILAFLQQYPEHELCYQGHLLIALCCQNGVQDIHGYITHSEKALFLKPNGSECFSLHIGLFHAYLKISQINPAGPQAEIDKAMDHLYAVCTIKPDILQSLYKHYISVPESNLKEQTYAIFSLACVLKQTGASTQALDLYTLLSRIKGIASYIAAATELHLARLTFAAMVAEQRSLENPKLVQILQTLKDLQIRKVLIQEPVHLEAALEYAAIRSSLDPSKTQKEQLLFYLLRAKEEFTAAQDLCSQDYYASCQRFPEKARIYDAYLLLFDAHIARLRGEIAHQEGRLLEGNESLSVAQTLYTKLLQEPIVSPYLVEKIRKQEV